MSAVIVTWVGVFAGAKVGLTGTVPTTGSAPRAATANANNESTVRFGMRMVQLSDGYAPFLPPRKPTSKRHASTMNPEDGSGTPLTGVFTVASSRVKDEPDTPPVMLTREIPPAKDT